MDAKTEALLRSRLSQLMVGKTLVLITHRASLLSMVDRIILLDKGVVRADGPKKQILEALKTGQINV
jgi:ATP-binding cassette subfamily C protein LapB